MFVFQKANHNQNDFLYNQFFCRSILDQINMSVVVTDLEERIIYINSLAEKLFGYTQKELIGKNPDILNAEDNFIEIQDKITKIIKQGKKWRGTIKNKRKNGTIFTNDLTVFPLVENNNVIGYVGCQVDVTERQINSHNLNLSLNKYHSIFKSAPVYIGLIDAQGILIDSNSMSEELLGYKREELIGQHYSKIIHPDYIGLAEKEMTVMQTNDHGNNNFSFYKMIRKDNTVIDVQIRTTSIIDEDQHFIHTIFFVIDMTERIKSENELVKLANELQSSNQELEQFAYVASHDLQEPLRVLSSYCQLLKEKYDSVVNHPKDLETERYFSYIIESTSRMRTLIRELLDFSRVGRKDRPFEFVDINEIIQEILEDYELSIKEKRAQIIIEDPLPEKVFAIRFRIKQLIGNLVSNSLKFVGKKDPVIRIGCCEENNEWLFYVSDNGIGIDSQYFDRIFGIFKRLYSREEYPGTGIGLALCKRIVEAHGGKIWVDSTVGEGTCMYFTIAKHMDILYEWDL